MPASLEPRSDLIEGIVVVQPLLLNVGDMIGLTVVTADARPEYSVRGRIAGVNEVMVNNAQSTRKARRLWLTQAVATLLLVGYLVSMAEFGIAIIRRTFLPFSLATGLVTGIGAVLLFVLQSPGELASASLLWPYMAIAILLSALILLFRYRQQSAG